MLIGSIKLFIKGSDLIISIPSTVREGFRTSNTLAKGRYLILYFVIMILGAQPTIIWFWYYWQYFPQLNLTFFVFMPLVFFIGIVVLIFGSAIVARFFLFFINIFHKPKEGIFERNKRDRDYCYWSLRSVIRKWPIWLARQLSIPLIEKLVYRILGGKASLSSALHEGWVDFDFMEIGKNVKIGKGCLITSKLIIDDKIIVKKVSIKDNAIVGSQSIVLPGTIIEKNSILDSTSMTIVNQKLEANGIYRGVPAQRIEFESHYSNKALLEKVIFKIKDSVRIQETDLKAEPVKLKVPFMFFVISGIMIIGGSFVLPAYIFIIYLYGFLIPQILTKPLTLINLLSLDSVVYLLLTPLIFILIYLFHLFLVAVFTRLFYRYADKHGSKPGVFDRNLAEASRALDYYHVRAFLFKYPIYSFLRSPFPWLLNWELNFIGSNKVGKGTVLEECYIHSHINYGKNCYLGTFCHLTNHLVDGVYGTENLTFFGVELGDSCVFNSLTGALPGTELGDHSTLLPMGTTIKFDKLEGNGFYAGFPVKRLNKKEITQFLGGMSDGE